MPSTPLPTLDSELLELQPTPGCTCSCLRIGTCHKACAFAQFLSLNGAATCMLRCLLDHVCTTAVHIWPRDQTPAEAKHMHPLYHVLIVALPSAHQTWLCACHLHGTCSSMLSRLGIHCSCMYTHTPTRLNLCAPPPRQLPHICLYNLCPCALLNTYLDVEQPHTSPHMPTKEMFSYQRQFVKFGRDNCFFKCEDNTRL